MLLSVVGRLFDIDWPRLLDFGDERYYIIRNHARIFAIEYIENSICFIT